MFRPINGYVAVKKRELVKTKSGILLSEKIIEGGGSALGEGNQQPVINGKVIAVSEGSKLKPGDLVSYRQTTVYKISNMEDGENVEIISEEHIFGIWEKDEN